MQIRRQYTPKPASDADFFEFDFGDPEAVNEFGDVGPNLAEGETILASPAPTVAGSLYPFAASQPATPAALTISAATIKDGPFRPASRVMVQVSGGTSEAEYLLSCTVRTSGGRDITRSARVLVTGL